MGEKKVTVEIKGNTLYEMFVWLRSAISAGAKAVSLRVDGKEVVIRPENVAAVVYNDGEFPSMDIYVPGFIIHLEVKEKEDDKEKIVADVEPLVPVKK